VRDAADFQPLDDVALVGLAYLRRVADVGGAIPGFDNLNLWVEAAEPAGAHAERDVSGLRGVVDDHHQLVHLGKGRVDEMLVSPVERGELAEGEPAG